MRYILNSAVLTAPGEYTYQHITVEKARQWLQQEDWESTIGYPETAEALTKLTGISPIPVNRKQITMQQGDEALVFRLTQRLSNAEDKGRLTVEDILKHCEIGLLTREW